MRLTRVCTKCRIEKSVCEFHFEDRTKGTRVSRCKDCYRLYALHRYRTSERVRQLAAQSNKKKRIKAQEFVLKYLCCHPCVDCGERDPIVLTFDHVRDKKTMDVSLMVRRRMSLKTIAREIEKCEVRCANCHMRKTSKQFGYYTFLCLQASPCLLDGHYEILIK